MTEPMRDALKLQIEAATAGFDWSELSGVWDKLHEEIGELREAKNGSERTEEVGDLLFMIVNLSRHIGVDPIAALHQANAKFTHRFAYVMQHSADLPPLGNPQRLERMEGYWTRAKAIERAANHK
jgi:uncharacterized protein YabN with tetrapyrrole methylase and pyrophosphatase domain